MNLITINPYNKEHRDLVTRKQYQAIFSDFISRTEKVDEKTWQQQKAISNEIEEYLVSLDQNELQNYCIYIGTKDNRMVQMNIGNLLQKQFIEKATQYAFQTLNAYTITLLSNQNHESLLSLGFECLGDHHGITMYLKEKGEKKEERVKL